MDSSRSLTLEADCALSLGPMWQSQDRLERSPDSAARQHSNDGLPASRKRVREDGASEREVTFSKATREKLRRDRLNDRFQELARELGPSTTVKVDKAVLLTEAVRFLVHLRAEAASLLTSNQQLQDQIKELKVEKSELREEKARLKAERERLRKELDTLTAPTRTNGFLGQSSAVHLQPSHTVPRAPHSAHETSVKVEAVRLPHHKHLPMWQFLPSAVADASGDRFLAPPVA
ncbi:unnamed protein product [Closterium sp. Yama58-4]|nr:unnamed protein product [Closterium sp. Yama58-4]